MRRSARQSRSVSGAALPGCVFTAARLSNCLLLAADLTGVAMEDCELMRCRLSGAKLARARLARSTFRDCDFSAFLVQQAGGRTAELAVDYADARATECQFVRCTGPTL